MKTMNESALCSSGLSDSQWEFLRGHLDNRIHTIARRIRGSIAGWLSKQWIAVATSKSQLAVLAKVQIGPRHHVALLEADGMRLLIATSTDGSVAFQELPNTARCDRNHGGSESLKDACACAAAAKQAVLMKAEWQEDSFVASPSGAPQRKPGRTRLSSDHALVRRRVSSLYAGVRAGAGRVSW